MNDDDDDVEYDNRCRLRRREIVDDDDRFILGLYIYMYRRVFGDDCIDCIGV